MPVSSVLCVMAASLVWTTSASSFKPNCTLPPESANYVSGPNTRGTLTILWNCISIVILCTWNILHLNIPTKRPYTQNLVQKAWWAIIDSRTKIKWMIFTILVPEFLVGKALNDWLSARWKFKAFSDFAKQDGTEWKAIHGYYANLGGFVLDFTELETVDEELVEVAAPGKMRPSHVSPASQEDLVESLRYLVNSMLQDEGEPVKVINLVWMRHGLWALNIGQLLVARQAQLIQGLPKISAEELSELDRGDPLVKIIAILQVLWLIIQLLDRKLTQLESSQLEIAVLAFSTSSLLTYALYLGRPPGVTKITKIKAKRLPSRSNIGDLLNYSPSYLWTSRRRERSIVGDLDLVPIPNDAGNPPAHEYFPDSIRRFAHGNTEVLTLIFGAVTGGVIFGGIHCIAWNFRFPTATEALLWRVASVTTSVLPLISVPFNFQWIKVNGPVHSPHERDKTLRPLVSTVLLAMLTMYLVSRLFLIVEIFRGLFYLPPGAFIDTWSSSIPHIG